MLSIGIVVGQTEFESKDYHPQMKIRMISTILCDNYFCRYGSLKFYADRLNGSLECTRFILYSVIM